MHFLTAILIILFLTFIVFSQERDSANERSNNPRPRVFIEESESWEVETDSISSTTDKKGRVTISGGGSKGGAKPRTAEIMKRFAEQCKSCVVTMYKDRADFVVRLDHEGGKDLFNKDNKLAVFNRDGDLIASGSFSRVRKAVETACKAIESDFQD